MADQSWTENDALPKIGRPATGALELAGYTRLGRLTTVTAKDLLALHGVGPKAIRILRAALAERGQAFAGATPGERSGYGA